MMIAPQNPKRSQLRYAADNGAFYSWTRKVKWDRDRFLKMIDRVQTFAAPPDFAVCPDIVAGGEKSLEFSLSWIGKLPAEWSWYLAVQDGMTPCGVLAVIDRFAGIFVGGTSEWKMTSLPQWALMAKQEKKMLHVGRVNSLARAFYAAKVCKADSFDGTNWNRTWDNNQKPVRVMGDSQIALNLFGIEGL